MCLLQEFLVLLLSTICLAVPANENVGLPIRHDSVVELYKQVIYETATRHTYQQIRTSRFKSRYRAPILGRTHLSFSTRQSGLNFEPCKNTDDCAGQRLCFDFDLDLTVPCTSNNCACLPRNPRDAICFSDRECDEGETCLVTPGARTPFCISDYLTSEARESAAPSAKISPFPSLAPSPSRFPSSSLAPSPSPSRSTSPGPPSISSIPSTPSQSRDSDTPGQLTLEPCGAASDCEEPRQCLDLDTSNPCDGGDCRCIQIVSCVNEDDCPAGEICYDSEDLGFSFGDEISFCASRTAQQAVCIGAHSLTLLRRDQLVFKQNVLAQVLCDVNNSCASPGHMVVYRDRPMMMRSYCEMAGCTRKIMQVNSPRYSRRLAFPSETKDLVFTALAARFATRAEEGFLSVAVRLGL